jgi:hypothetical protein
MVFRRDEAVDGAFGAAQSLAATGKSLYDTSVTGAAAGAGPNK